MRISSLFLSSAALLASATLGHAADLPSKKAAPVDYVRVCNINNAFTGFVIPGTDTCLKIGGFVRYQATGNEPKWTGQAGNGREKNVATYAATASIKLDARQTTEYGLLRSFADVRVSTANYTGTSGPAAIDKAYIQFAGLHAGKIQSIFDFYADDASYGGAGLGSDHSAVALGYTFQFGGGYYLAVSIEDPSATRAQTNYYAGQRAPDLIVAAGGDQSWGSFKLSGAVHQLQSVNASFLLPSGAKVSSAGTEYGFAIQGGVKINLPMLGATDALFLQAAYADGAVTYLGLPGSGFGHLVANSTGSTYSAGYDFAFDRNGSIKKTTGYNLTAAFEHAWSPNWSSNIFGGYTVYDPSKSAASATSFVAYPAAYDGTNPFQARKAEVVQVGANLTWFPVKGLKIGGEVSYFGVKLDKGVSYTTANPTLLKKSDNVVQTLLRIQRDF